MLYFQRTRGIAIIFALWFVSPSASPHGIRTVSASDTLTGILSRATSIASTQVNEYCSTNEDTAFNITIDNHLQRIFAIDQALRFQLFASIDKAKWLSKIYRFDQAESKYVSNLSKDHQSRKQILSSSQGSFELFLLRCTLRRSTRKPLPRQRNISIRAKNINIMQHLFMSAPISQFKNLI